MGIFDTRCAVTGAVLRTGEVLLLPLVEDASGSAFALGLPIAGTSDGYGNLDPMTKSAAVDLFAKGFGARAVFPGGGAPKGGKKLVTRLVALDEPSVTLDGRRIHVAYVLRSVYEALIAAGARDAEVSMRLRGKKGDALFDVAFKEADLARGFYAQPSDAAEKEIRLALTALARSGLGLRALPPATVEDRAQYEDEEIERSIAEAKKRFATVPEVDLALTSYGKSLLSDDEDDDEEDHDGGATQPILPALCALFEAGALGFAKAGNAFERPEADGRSRLYVGEVGDGAFVEVDFELSLTSGGTSRCNIARAKSKVEDPAAAAETIVRDIEQRLAIQLDEGKCLAGGAVAMDRMIALARANRWFLAEVAKSPQVSGDVVGRLAIRLKEGPYTDDVRAAWIAILGRSDCPIEVAKALEAHPSKSLREAVAARLARG